MDIIKRLSEKLKNFGSRSRIAIILGAAGMLLIMLSEVVPPDRSNDKTSAETGRENDESEEFRQKTESDLKALLENIEGVGCCEVMISVEGTTEYVYAENISKSIDENSERRSDKLDENVVLIENSGNKQALVKKVIRPQISGAVVVCEGGGDIRVNERVLKAVSTALNISSSRVYVESKANSSKRGI